MKMRNAEIAKEGLACDTAGGWGDPGLEALSYPRFYVCVLSAGVFNTCAYSQGSIK